ncbi:hypothetical protein G9464_19815 [Halostella sp. JP-L12]|uniref:hypothetical protein n=1 Tax=Halostella TaxID=1843185 RepID=UPI000EF7A73F|nr:MULTISPECIES: hypothetical protein [Halostella]NHN49819.1 hypothetical protein [Halostella sp. JP-L12]
MSAVPGDIETDAQPPMAVPLRHFVVALGFLVAAVAAGAVADGPVTDLAHLHLLLAGWVCITIMGAMTQFVPVWSGTELHSQRLAGVQLWLIAAGLAGFAGALLTERLDLLPFAGGAMLAGFWTFVYNVGRTLATARPLDVTERHFALALAYFLALTAFGLTLAVGFTRPVFADLPVVRPNVVRTHATLAVFGAVLTTVFGALYQLATMFTQTELHGVDRYLQAAEEVGYPAGVVALAGGRLVENLLLARVGGVLVVGSVLCVAAILARKLAESSVPRTPMLSRYAVAAGAMTVWALLTAPSWVADPLAPEATFGAPGARTLLLAAVGFVVLGTLYHVVPFIVWVHRYSDLLGFEQVPMIDDLYDDRVAAADFVALVGGVGALAAIDLLGAAGGGTTAVATDGPSLLATAAGGLVLAGVLAFAANLLFVLRRHGPQSIPAVLVGAGGGTGDAAPDDGRPSGGDDDSPAGGTR